MTDTSTPSTKAGLEQLQGDLAKTIDSLHKAEKKRTLEEQVAYLKSQGIDPAKSYKTWDDDTKDDDW